jgi:hypothetical protein
MTPEYRMQPGETYREDVNERELRRLEELAKSQAPTPAPDADALDENLDEEEPDDFADAEDDELFDSGKTEGYEKRMEEILAEALELWCQEHNGTLRCRTFADDGVLTYNKVLVVKIHTTEFQITIVRSR